MKVTAEKAKGTAPTRSHELLASLPVSELWTTNYDDLIERAKPDAVILARESDVISSRNNGGPRVIKMHGGMLWEGGRESFAEPVLTRGDFESYEVKRPRTWALLRSTFLTKSMLFLGFSFDDPNLEVMLRLARSLDSPMLHYTVMRKPTKPTESRLHDLRVRDLERSGIHVHEVASFDDIQPLLEELSRRTRPASIFISGSEDPSVSLDFTTVCKAIGSRLAELPVTLHSLAGPAAGKVSHSFASTRIKHDEGLAAEAIRFYFGSKTLGSARGPTMLGTQVYTHNSTETICAPPPWKIAGSWW